MGIVVLFFTYYNNVCICFGLNRMRSMRSVTIAYMHGNGHCREMYSSCPNVPLDLKSRLKLPNDNKR